MFKTTIAAALIIAAAGTANAQSAAQAEQATRQCAAQIQENRPVAPPFDAYFDGEYYHVMGFPEERWRFFKCLNAHGLKSTPVGAN